MEDDEHKRQVMRVFEKSLDRDRAKSQVCEVSPIGLSGNDTQTHT